ncbi:hypothetical protein, partial [Bacillus cereus]|uniref:hypothetical protein n=1 Tax=Bacillus cereus TaxID=1396 RepID=UPI0019D53E0A
NGYNEYITVVEDDSGFILLRTDKRAAFILLYSWFFYKYYYNLIHTLLKVEQISNLNKIKNTNAKYSFATNRLFYQISVSNYKLFSR